MVYCKTVSKIKPFLRIYVFSFYYVTVPLKCLVPMKVRRRHQVTKVLEVNLGPLEEEQVLLPTEPSL